MILDLYVHLFFFFFVFLYCYQETKQPQISCNIVSPENAKETDDAGYARWSGLGYGTLGLVLKPIQLLLLCIKQMYPVLASPSLAWSALESHSVFEFEDLGTKRIAEKMSLQNSVNR